MVRFVTVDVLGGWVHGGVPVRFIAMAAAKKSSERIKITCNCGASLMAPKKAVGRKVKCPRCDKVFTVPDPGSTVDRMIYALSDDQYNKPALEEQPEPPAPKETEKGKLCPNCNSEMKKDAALCIRCGFHLDRGAAIAAASVGTHGGGVGGFFSRLFKRK